MDDEVLYAGKMSNVVLQQRFTHERFLLLWTDFGKTVTIDAPILLQVLTFKSVQAE